MSVAYYTPKTKDICDPLASIDVNLEEEKMVQACLRGLALKFGALGIAVCTRENYLLFFLLQSMLFVEENYADVSTSTHADNKILYTEEDRPSGCGGQGKSACNGSGRQEQVRRHSRNAESSS